MDSLPDQLRGAETGTFAHYSIVVRLPEIARRMMADNEFDGPIRKSVQAVIDSIADGEIEPVDQQGPDADAWTAYVAPHVGLSWLDAPWFFVELYFYRRLMDAVGYWDRRVDPFRGQKLLGLEQALAPGRESIANIDAAYARGVSTDFLLIQLTDAALWGNQIDLSLWPAEEGGAAVLDSHTDRLLSDDRPAAIRSLRGRHPGPIDVVLDNAGSELVADLLTTDLLLRSDLATTARLHAKQYPVFVSDAMESDVVETMRQMAADTHPHLRSAGERLRAELAAGRIVITSDPYWVSPLEWRARPTRIDQLLDGSHLVIVKGDANYRRLLGDRHWDFTTPFAVAVGSCPAPLLALRTLKAEVAAGLGKDAVARAAATDPDWLTDGRWAVASFVPSDL